MNRTQKNIHPVKGILLMGHGSPEQAGNDDFFSFVENYRRHRQSINPREIVEGCVIEHAEPDLDKGIDLMAEKGVTELYCLPLILFEAGHAKSDIPEAILRGRKKYPHINFIPGSTIGTHPFMLEIIRDKINEILSPSPTLGEGRSEGHEDDTETGLLFVGRGSLDPFGNSDLYKMARVFWESSNFKGMEVSYVGVTKPTIEDTLLKMYKLGCRRTILIPYFLFTGVLIPRIHDKVKKFQAAHAEMEIRVTDYFGHHPLIFKLLDEKLKEARLRSEKGNCYLSPHGPCELNSGTCSHCLNKKA